MSRPISQLWGTPFRDIKYEERAGMAGQALAVTPSPQTHNSNNNSIGVGRPSCGLHWQPRVPFQGIWSTLIAASRNPSALLSVGALIGNRPQRRERLKLSIGRECQIRAALFIPLGLLNQLFFPAPS